MTSSKVRTYIVISLAVSLFIPLFVQGETDSPNPKPEKKDTLVLAKDHLPGPLPYTLSEKVRRLLDLHDISRALVSPRGDTVYYNWNVTGVDQVWMLTAPQSYPVQLTSGESKTKLEAISPDGKYIYITRDENGAFYDGLYRIHVETKQIEPLFKENKVKVYFGGLSRDGERVYFRANDKDKEYMTVYRYDIKKGETETVYHSKHHWKYAGEISSDKVYLYRIEGHRERELYTYDMRNEKLRRELSQKNVKNLGYFDAKPLSEGRVILRSHHDSDFYRLSLWDGKKIKHISPKHSGDVMSGFVVDAQQSTVYYSLDSKGKARIQAIDLETMESLKTPLPSQFHESKPTQLYVQSVSRSGQHVVIRAQGPQLPDQLYVWDRDSDEVKPWTQLSTPEINLKAFVEPSLETCKAKDGTEIPIIVRRSEDCMNKLCPVVVHYHGGPEAESRPDFRPLGELFVQSGYIFVEPNVRGSRGQGRKSLESDDGPKRAQVISDIRDCARDIKKRWQVDGVKPLVGITGRSYGGYLTLYGMTAFAGEYDAGAAIVGMSSLVTLLENTAPYRRQRRESEYGRLTKDRDTLEKLSPINMVEKLQDPLLIIHGANDKIVPVSEAIQFKEKLLGKDNEPELIIFPDEGHKVTRRENRVLEYGHLLRFFDKHLKRPLRELSQEKTEVESDEKSKEPSST